eukprot:m.82775 g.82775  ORF g.82775 m.82775 type:complete len:57 (+) comp14317_c0_seq1:5711-5881(+)
MVGSKGGWQPPAPLEIQQGEIREKGAQEKRTGDRTASGTNELAVDVNEGQRPEDKW